MRIIKFFIALFLSFVCVDSFANVVFLSEERTEPHGQYFATGGRKIAINVPKGEEELGGRLAEFFARCGAQVEMGFFAQLIYPTVSLKQKEGADEGYTIRVRRGSIRVVYSSPIFASKAVDALEGLFAEPYAQRMIRGVDIVSVVSGKRVADPSGITVREGGVVDCAVRFHSSAAIQSAIKRQTATGNRGVVVLLGSPEAMRLNLECFRVFNPNTNIVPRNECYTQQMASEVVRSSEQLGARVTFGVDLLGENPKFRFWSGHELSSVEGMRIVRAMVEELAGQWGVRRLYIGSKTGAYASDTRYREFLDQIAARNNVELVVR